MSRKITQNTAITGAQIDIANDQIPIVDVSDTTDGASGTTKKTTVSDLSTAIGAGAPFSDASALVKNGSDATKKAIISAANITTGTTRTYTLQDRNGTLADIYNPLLTGTSKNRYIIAGANATAPTTGSVSANTLRAGPFVVRYPMTIDRIAFEVTTGTSGKMRVGIWSDDGTGYPSTLILDGGEQTITAPGVYGTSTVVSATLQPGLYWVGFLTDTANTCRVANAGMYDISVGAPSTFGAFIFNGWGVSLTYGALPNPFTASAVAAANNIPIIGMRVV